jgi:hypothetical protein
LIDNEAQTHLDQILLTTQTLAMTEKLQPIKTTAEQDRRYSEKTNLPESKS